MTMEFNAYIFDTYEAAEATVQQCDDYYGFPIEATETTAQINQYDGKWYIIADELTKNVLGDGYKLITLSNEQNDLQSE